MSAEECHHLRSNGALTNDKIKTGTSKLQDSRGTVINICQICQTCHCLFGPEYLTKLLGIVCLNYLKDWAIV